MFRIKLHVVPVVARQVHKVDPTLNLGRLVHLPAARNSVVESYSTLARDRHGPTTDKKHTCRATPLLHHFHAIEINGAANN